MKVPSDAEKIEQVRLERGKNTVLRTFQMWRDKNGAAWLRVTEVGRTPITAFLTNEEWSEFTKAAIRIDGE